MLSYVAKRLGLSVAVILLAMLALFSLLHFIPGDPATISLGPRATPEAVARYAAKMHLDQPVWRQFFIFVGNVLTGDLGNDVFSDRPVLDLIGERIGFWLALVFAGMGWAMLLGIPLGCLAAVRPGSLWDRLTGILSVATIAVPSFLVAIWALLIFSIKLGRLPVMDTGEPGALGDQISHLILPAFSIGLGWVGYLARIVRASMLEVMDETYIRAARAFGLRPGRIIYSYALRIALLPHGDADRHGVWRADLCGGLHRDHFGRPGLGKFIYDAISDRNFPVEQGGVIVATSLYVGFLLLSDLVNAWLDPRVRAAL